MSEHSHDIAPKLAALSDIPEALGLLSRLPLPNIIAPRGAKTVWAYPLAGAVIGAVAAALGAIALGLGLGAGPAAALALLTSVAITGALHEDGLADCADGFWGGFDPIRRLEIMRDSRIGTYGVLALGFSLLLRWSALSVLFAHGLVWTPLIGAAIAGRMAMIWPMQRLNYARDNGLARELGRPSTNHALLATALSFALLLMLLGAALLPIILVLAALTFGLCRLALAKIGGQTGDVLGAIEQVGEISVLLTLVACLT